MSAGDCGRRSPPSPAPLAGGAAIARKIRRKALKRLNPRPELPLAPLWRGEGWGEGLGRLAADAHPAPHPNLLPARGEKERGGDRPENPAQALKRLNSAPGMTPLRGGADVDVSAGANLNRRRGPALSPSGARGTA